MAALTLTAPRRATGAAHAVASASHSVSASGSVERVALAPKLLADALRMKKEGFSASAYALALDAAHQALQEGEASTELQARALCEQWRPTLAKIRLVITEKPGEAVIKVDGVVLSPAQWSDELPVDVGAHTVTSTEADNDDTKSVSVFVAEDGEVQTVRVPRLDHHRFRTFIPIPIADVGIGCCRSGNAFDFWRGGVALGIPSGITDWTLLAIPVVGQVGKDTPILFGARLGVSRLIGCEHCRDRWPGWWAVGELNVDSSGRWGAAVGAGFTFFGLDVLYRPMDQGRYDVAFVLTTHLVVPIAAVIAFLNLNRN